MEKYMNEYIKTLKDYEPVESDSALRSKYSLGNKEIIRLNANENPYGSISEINNNLSKISFHNYPDPNQSELRKYFFNIASLTKLVSILKKLFRSYF